MSFVVLDHHLESVPESRFQRAEGGKLWVFTSRNRDHSDFGSVIYSAANLLAGSFSCTKTPEFLSVSSRPLSSEELSDRLPHFLIVTVNIRAL